jgi:uncharacterized membrane-anchored protein
MSKSDSLDVSKVPAVTAGFWLIKILATTLGETGGDTVSMTMRLGYLASTGIFLVLLFALVAMQIRTNRFHPFLYWATIIASTTAGTTLADFATRSLGIGYTGGSVLLLASVAGALVLWRLVVGSVASDHITTPKVELFYWSTITLSQTLGTALGDWTADTNGLGYLGAAVVFGGLLAFVAGLTLVRQVNRIVLFWAAFILTRPLGAVLGDFLDKPREHGGLAFSRPVASVILAVAIISLILILPQRQQGEHASAEHR